MNTNISPEPLSRGFGVSFVLAGPGGRVPLLVVTRKLKGMEEYSPP